MSLASTIKIVIAGDAKGAERALHSVQKEADKTGKSFKTASKVAALGMVAMAATAVELGKDAVKAAMAEETAHAKLLTALTNTKQGWGKVKDVVEQADKAGEHFGYTSAETEAVLAQLETSTGDTAKSMKLLGLAQDLVALKGGDLASAALAVTKASQGQLKPLKALGVDLPVVAGGALKTKKAYEAWVAAAVAVAVAEGKRHDVTLKSLPTDDKVAKAKKKLTDLEVEMAAKGRLTVAEQLRLADARDAVTQAEKDNAAATARTSTSNATAVSRSQDAQATAVQKAKDKEAAAQKTFNDTAHSGDTIMSALGKKLKGQASAAADKFAGKTKELKAKWEDFQARVGTKVIPVLVRLMTTIAGFTDEPNGLIARFARGADKIATAWSTAFGTVKQVVVDIGNAIEDVLNGIITGINGLITAINLVKPGTDIAKIPTLAPFSADGKQAAPETGKTGTGSGTTDGSAANHMPGWVPPPFYGPVPGRKPTAAKKPFYGPVQQPTTVVHQTVHLHAQPTAAVVNGLLARHAKRNGPAAFNARSSAVASD